MKYYVIQDVDCYYTLKEDDFHGQPEDIVCTCDKEEWAKIICNSLAKEAFEMSIED